MCFPFERNIPPPVRTGGGDVGGASVGVGAECSEGSVEEAAGETLFASRACLRSLKDACFAVGGADGGVDEDEADGVSVLVDTGFMKSSEAADVEVDNLVDVVLLDSAGMADVLEELAAGGEVEAGAALSTIFIGTRRRFGGVVVVVDAFGVADVAADAPLSGGEATSIGVRFCDVSNCL